MSIAAELSPRTLGEDRFDLQVTTSSPAALNLVTVSVSYARADPEGIVLPLVMRVVGPSGAATTQVRHFQRFAPSELTFRPLEGGPTLVTLSELFHNRWFGRLVFDVSGDPLEL